VLHGVTEMRVLKTCCGVVNKMLRLTGVARWSSDRCCHRSRGCGTSRARLDFQVQPQPQLSISSLSLHIGSSTQHDIPLQDPSISSARPSTSSQHLRNLGGCRSPRSRRCSWSVWLVVFTDMILRKTYHVRPCSSQMRLRIPQSWGSMSNDHTSLSSRQYLRL
jgi:hypothetical protein